MRSTRFLSISAANIGPNRFQQNRTVSWQMSMPRSWSSVHELLDDHALLPSAFQISPIRRVSPGGLSCGTGRVLEVRATEPSMNIFATARVRGELLGDVGESFTRFRPGDRKPASAR
jgi:hypothetical protein